MRGERFLRSLSSHLRCFYPLLCASMSAASLSESIVASLCSKDVIVMSDVEGYGSRTNSLLLALRHQLSATCSAGASGTIHPGDTYTGTVVFFPGDVQNYEEKMKHHPFNKAWQAWTFENTMDILRKRFPHSHVIMVTPSRRVEEAFSCFQNFMEVDATGSPVNYNYHEAWEHLRLLLESAWRRIDKEESGSNEVTSQKCSQDIVENSNVHVPAEQHSPHDGSPVTLIGFSKGCTVLNQLVVELPEASMNPALLTFISRIRDFYWLDGGHSGPISTYVTDDSCLKDLAKLKATIRVHVTPYQVKDEGRPHIGEDHQSFLTSLLSHGVNVQQKLHFPEERRSLKRHFEVLRVF